MENTSSSNESAEEIDARERRETKQRVVDNDHLSSKLETDIVEICERKGWTRITLQLDGTTIHSSAIAKYPKNTDELASVLYAIIDTMPNKAAPLGFAANATPKLKINNEELKNERGE